MKTFVVTLSLRDVSNGGGLMAKRIRADSYSIGEWGILTFVRQGWASDLHFSPNAWAWVEEVKDA